MSNVQNDPRDVTPENGVELDTVPHVAAVSAGPPSTQLTAAQRVTFGDEEPGERWDGQG